MLQGKYFDGFGLTIPGLTDIATGEKSVSSGVFDMVTGTVLSLVPGGNLIGGLITTIGSLFGAAPRGNFEKFKRTAYPYMRTLAAQAKIPVCIGWFGDVVAVNPDGSFGVVLEQSTGWPTKLASSGYHPFYEADCNRSDGDCVNHPSELFFRLIDPYDITKELAQTSSALVLNPSNTIPTVSSTGSKTLLMPVSQAGLFPTDEDANKLLLYGGIAVIAFMLISSKWSK